MMAPDLQEIPLRSQQFARAAHVPRGPRGVFKQMSATLARAATTERPFRWAGEAPALVDKLWGPVLEVKGHEVLVRLEDGRGGGDLLWLSQKTIRQSVEVGDLVVLKFRRRDEVLEMEAQVFPRPSPERVRQEERRLKALFEAGRS